MSFVSSEDLKCDEWVDHPVLLVERDTFANFFHDSEDFVNAFLAMAILDWSIGETQVGAEWKKVVTFQEALSVWYPLMMKAEPLLFLLGLFLGTLLRDCDCVCHRASDVIIRFSC